MNYDSILVALDSTVINRTEQYKQGVVLPDRTVPVAERTYALGGDDYVVAGMMVMFCVLAVVFYHNRWLLFYRIKDFFTTKRQYSEEHVNDNSSWSMDSFLLISISALSLSIVFFDDVVDIYCFSPDLGVPYWVLAVGYVFCMAIIYLKAWIYALVNWVFFDSESSKRWQVGYFLMTSLTAFFFYPIALVDVFFDEGQTMVTICAILVGVLYEILLFYKLLSNFKTKKYGYLLIFLYFCTVELMPALVLWNVVGGLSDNFIIKEVLY